MGECSTSYPSILPCDQDQHKDNPLEMVTKDKNIKTKISVLISWTCSYQYHTNSSFTWSLQNSNWDQNSMPGQDKNDHSTTILESISSTNAKSSIRWI